MTEEEWTASDDPGAMLSEVTKGISPAHDFRISDRKLRLFAVACCRQLQHLFADRRQVRAVDLAERWADGEALHDELYDLTSGKPGITAGLHWADAAGSAWLVADSARRHNPAIMPAWAHLLRDIVGNPHRPVSLLPGKRVACRRCDGLGRVPPRITTACPACKGAGGRAEPCPWLTPTVVSLAHAAYDSRDEQTGHLDPVRLAVLADALEEAGCGVGRVHFCEDGATAFWWNDLFGKSWPHLTPDRAAAHPLLAHLRSPGPHVRGCWAIDLLTGRE